MSRLLPPDGGTAGDGQESGAGPIRVCGEEQNRKYAPLAQLVEHLTLNQGVQGSSP